GTVRGQPLVNFDSAGFDGRLLGGAFGIEGMASSSVLVGARIGYDDTNLTTALDGLPGHLDSRSFSIIPYAAWKPGETWVFDAHIGFKRTEFDFFNGGVGAEVNSDRFIAGLGASALYGFAGLQVIPRFSGLIAVDSAVSFTDSAGIDVPTNRLTYFEASGGAEIGYPVQLGAMRLTPWVAGHIVGVLDDVGGASLVGDTVFGRFGAGLRLGAGPLDIVLEGRASGFGPRDFNDYQGMLRIAYSFQ
ncbi:MAG: autotransporter domain-containing protein, partial [Bacteroidota bacterium]